MKPHGAKQTRDEKNDTQQKKKSIPGIEPSTIDKRLEVLLGWKLPVNGSVT